MESMTSGESPMIARRRVRLALREAREARGFTQGEIAEAMEWSLSKVIRIENGDVSISPNDLRPLLNHLQIRDRATVDALLLDAKASRVRKQQFWWQDPSFRDHLTEPLQRLIAFEREAVAVRFFAMSSAPGYLQTRAYAQAVLSQWHTGLSDDDINIRLDARMRRHDDMLGRAVRLSLLLDESLVYRTFGDEAALVDELSYHLRLITEDRVDLRIVPFTVKVPLPTFGSFELVYFTGDGDDDNAVIYRELDFLDEIVEDRSRANQLRTRFEEVWNASMDRATTPALIHQRLSELRLGSVPQPTPYPANILLAGG